MRNIYLKLMYKGTNYSGWQRQENAVTIQEVLENAIYKVTSEKVKTVASGRTDKGVHALGQVINFHTDTKIKEENIKFAINYNLPLDIRVIESREVEEDFNARFSAKEKTYVYLIDNSEVKNPFYIENAMNINYKLDIEKMISEAKSLIGIKDFSSFYKVEKNNPKNPIRNIKKLTIEKEENLIKIEITAESFLYNMVRIIVGTLIDIGSSRNKMSIEEILSKKDRKYAGFTAEAKGLYLKEVIY